MNDNAKEQVRPTSPLDRFVRRLRELDHAVFNRSDDDVLRAVAAIDFDELADEIERLQLAYSGLDAYKRALSAENERLRKDAERYRWLCKAGKSNRVPHIAQYSFAAGIDKVEHPHFCKVGIDAAVDAAMASDA